jgi:cytochrome c biogenesis protein CcmG, thiol:disulfide interchange protein DsbE
MSRRTLLLGLGAIAVVAVVAVGLAQSGEGVDSEDVTVMSASAVAAKLAGAPPQLAALHAQANELIPGSPTTVERQIAQLKGTPVVVNMWGSWCGPCRLEMPFMQQANATFGKEVAFLGVNSVDSEDGARKLLRQIPVGYPSFIDGKGTIAQKLASSTGLPITVYYDAAGKQQIHQGVYATQADLDRDVKRYALGQSAR